MQNKIRLNNFEISNDSPLTIISGPCQLESIDHSLNIAETLMKACSKFDANFIFKGSFDKANRTSMNGKRGLGIEEGLRVMQEVKSNLGCPTITDVHTAEQCSQVAKIWRKWRLFRWPKRVCTSDGKVCSEPWYRRCFHRVPRRSR